MMKLRKLLLQYKEATGMSWRLISKDIGQPQYNVYNFAMGRSPGKKRLTDSIRDFLYGPEGVDFGYEPEEKTNAVPQPVFTPYRQGSGLVEKIREYKKSHRLTWHQLGDIIGIKGGTLNAIGCGQKASSKLASKIESFLDSKKEEESWKPAEQIEMPQAEKIKADSITIECEGFTVLLSKGKVTVTHA